MKAYKITATFIDNNGVRVTSNNAETLGEAHGKFYLTRESAEDALSYLEGYRPEGYEDVNFDLEEFEVDCLVEGQAYDINSVAAVMMPLPEGYNVVDFFTSSGAYLGADDDGVEITIG